jgi:hypothetical protein
MTNLQIVAQLFMGWPAIFIFMALATFGTWCVRVWPIALALVFALGPSLYIVGMNNLVIGLYIPLSLVISLVLVWYRKPVVPRVLLVPVYCFYIALGYFVATQ